MNEKKNNASFPAEIIARFEAITEIIQSITKLEKIIEDWEKKIQAAVDLIQIRADEKLRERLLSI